MTVYVVIDNENIYDIAIFQNKTEAEDYMIDYIFDRYDTEVMLSKEKVLAMIRDNEYFRDVNLIEKEII